MAALTIPRSIQTILVVGPFFGKTDKLLRAQTLIPNYDLTVFNGGLYLPFQDTKEVLAHLDVVRNCVATGKAAYCLHYHDEMLINGLLTDCDRRVAEFFSSCPNVVEASFTNGHKILVMNGGITPKMTRKKLENDMEVCFIDQVDGKPWHKSYDGRFGYVISNNPITSDVPQFYNFSAQIGSEHEVYAQEADQFGLKRTIVL
jgi:hypothetical protein